jgi:uncharacterized protein (TIGR00297 family)
MSASGAVAAALVGFAVFGFAGGAGAVALLLFFVTSSALSRFRKRDKERLDYEKGGERDAGQVLANGGVAALCALLVPVFPGAAWPFVALLGALAEANADTWATEIGSLARRPPRLITTGQPAPPGASGAVSLPGTLAALAGAFIIALVAVWRPGGGTVGIVGLLAATAGGFVGALADSLLGATVQAQFRCPVCGKLTERRTHCDQRPTEHARGLRWFNNDLVNALATVIGALVAGSLFAMSAAR